MAKKEKEVKEKKTSYFKGMKQELKKVTWPTPKELFNNTVAVIGFVLIIAIIVFILDFCFDNLNKNVFTKFQEKVQTTFKVEETENEENSSEENDETNEQDAEGNNEETEKQESTENADE